MKFPFRIIDLTHLLVPESPSWDLDCGFIHSTILDYEECTEHVKFRAQKLTMPAGMGTHIDAPAHCIKEGATVANLDLERNYLLAQSVVIDVSKFSHERYIITSKEIIDFEHVHGTISENAFIIFHTGWCALWEDATKYRNNLVFPSISAEAAKLLITRNVAGIGIDTLSPDRPESGYPVHEIMLEAGKYIIENVANASALPPLGAWTLALPMNIKDATEAPVRLVGLI